MSDSFSGRVPLHDGYDLGAIGVSCAKGHSEDDRVANAGIAALQLAQDS